MVTARGLSYLIFDLQKELVFFFSLSEQILI